MITILNLPGCQFGQVFRTHIHIEIYFLLPRRLNKIATQKGLTIADVKLLKKFRKLQLARLRRLVCFNLPQCLDRFGLYTSSLCYSYYFIDISNEVSLNKGYTSAHLIVFPFFSQLQFTSFPRKRKSGQLLGEII